MTTGQTTTANRVVDWRSRGNMVNDTSYSSEATKRLREFSDFYINYREVTDERSRRVFPL